MPRTAALLLRRLAFSTPTMASALNTRQRDLLRLLLNHDTPIATADLAHRMGLTRRQVDYALDGVRPWLVHRNANLQLTPGVGAKVECSQPQRHGILNELTSNHDVQPILTPSERRHLIALRLLTADEPLILARLQYGSQVSRTTILKDLDLITEWLGSLGLKIIRRPNFGIQVSDSELHRREAIGALLWGQTPLGEPLWTISHSTGLTFSLTNDGSVLPLVNDLENVLDAWDIMAALNWVDLAETELGGEFTDDGALHFALSLSVQVQRVGSGNRFTCEAETIRWLSNQYVWPTAKTVASAMWPDSGPEEIIDEIAGISMHLLCTARRGAWLGDAGLDHTFVDLVDTILEEAAQALGLPELAQDATLRDGLMAHLIPAYMRQRFGIWSPPSLPLSHLPRAFEGEREVAEELAGEVSKRIGLRMPDEEVNNLALLLRAAVIRARPERQHRAVVVCPSGMATAQLLFTQLKASFPQLEILGALPLRALSRERLTDVELIIATIPLSPPAPWVHVIHTQPLLSPEDKNAIARWLNARVNSGQSYSVERR